jgi:tetratricopeptide (TPR) repeat protein
MNKRRSRSTVRGAVVAAWLAFGAAGPARAAPPSPAHGAPATSESEAHFQRGLELHQEQDFAGALVEFRRSYELMPTYKMLYNIGQVCYQLNDYACALRSFETYLKEGDAAIASERRAEVERELRKLRARVGRLEIVANVPGVEVSVDDVPVGTTPLRELVVVSTGRRRVTGTREGYAPVTRYVEVAGADSIRLPLTFAKAGESSEPAGAPPRESRWTTLSWIGLGTSAALAAGAGVTGVFALGASNDVRDSRYALDTGPSKQMLADRDRAKALAVTSDVLLGASVVTLVATLVYTYVHKPRAVETAKGDKVGARAGASPAGAFLVGRF